MTDHQIYCIQLIRTISYVLVREILIAHQGVLRPGANGEGASGHTDASYGLGHSLVTTPHDGFETPSHRAHEQAFMHEAAYRGF